MKVSLIDYMGSDLSIVNAARVSFNKKSEWIYPSYPDPSCGMPPKLSDRDVRLIRYLAKHNHWTPFAHTAITLHIKAPLFVARQLGKHQVGFVWNEVSRRYVTEDPEFYTPDVWRKAAKNVKQGSSDEEVEHLRLLGFKWQTTSDAYEKYLEYANSLYQDMIDAGVCAEQARMVLPQSMYTEWYWTGNLYGYYNVWKLRTDPHTQKETQEVAKQIGLIMSALFPESWGALTYG